MERSPSSRKRSIDHYEHPDKTRLNNPPVGLVSARSDAAESRKTYTYDPHLDPQLVWAGKAERTSFEVPTVSLHVHERIDPLTITDAIRRRSDEPQFVQASLFESPTEYLPIRDALDFYRHPHGWSNRMIAGDSLLVMSSLLEKEGLAGQVQLIYLDPPFGRSLRRTSYDLNPATGLFESEYANVFDGVVHKYRPDFLIRLTTGAMLVLEVKGQESPESATKHAFLDEWVRAINGHGRFGAWTWAVSRAPGDVSEILRGCGVGG